MENLQDLPDWYVLRKGRIGKEVDIGELVEEGRKRIEFLNSSNIIDVKVHHDHYLGHLALRITAAVSKNRIFINWLIEREGDLFQKFFDIEPFQMKIVIIRDLFDNEILLDYNEIFSTIPLNMNEEELRSMVASALPPQRKLLPSDKLVATKYYYINRVLKDRVGFLRDGWVILPFRILRGQLKNIFQKRLLKAIHDLRDKIQAEGNTEIFESISNLILEFWRKKSTKDKLLKADFHLQSKKLFSYTKYYPPCMMDLITKLRETGYLAHNERLQLGLFLKRLGMSLEEQLEFWYRNAVDNIGISREEFERKAGYIIRHIYGLEGSRKDYEVPKCETIVNRYHCFFSNNDMNSISNFLINEQIEKKAKDEIIGLVKSKKFTMACSKFLNARFRIEYKKPMSHPLLYFRIAYRTGEKKNYKKSSASSDENGSKT